MKKILIIALILCSLNFLVMLKMSGNIDRNLILNDLSDIVIANSGGYGNYMDGDTYQCAIWQEACFCYVQGCRVWCMEGSHYCVESECLHAPGLC